MARVSRTQGKAVKPSADHPRRKQGQAYDSMCMFCGRIKEGPHKGHRVKMPKDVANHPEKVPVSYYGTPISHGACDPPCKENFMVGEREERYQAQLRGTPREVAWDTRQPLEREQRRPTTAKATRQERYLEGRIVQARDKWARTGDPKDLRSYQDLEDKRRR